MMNIITITPEMNQYTKQDTPLDRLFHHWKLSVNNNFYFVDALIDLIEDIEALPDFDPEEKNYKRLKKLLDRKVINALKNIERKYLKTLIENIND